MTLPCARLDEFFDGELSGAEADAFRAHLATCPRCQPALLGRMQEELLVGTGDAAATAIPRRLRPRHIVTFAAAVALAATVAFVLKSRGTPESAPPAVALVIERAHTVVRGNAAHVGDRLHVTANGPSWIYRGDHELVLACPGDAGCRAGGSDLLLGEPGVYSVVVISSVPPVPAPRGSFDGDVAAAVKAGASYKVETIDVQ